MRIEQRAPSRSLGLLFSLFGYSRQAYYQQFKIGEEEALQDDLLIQEVLRIRHTQKRLGARKLLIMTDAFRAQHAISIGRDSFFKLLQEQGLSVRIFWHYKSKFFGDVKIWVLRL